ncbi:MAG: hypothetical protein EG826_08910 [Deltaproteobacteria bacterium]|nr:hypothetical protein [Deltaproteobacteria bacterium]
MKRLLPFLVILAVLQCLFGYAALHQDSKTIALINGTLIDGNGGTPLANAVVIIRGGKIAEVGTRAMLAVPEGSLIIDAQGGTILPGFINAHVHNGYNESLLREWAQAGVTTVRDLAAMPPYTSFSDRDRFNKNPQNARLVATGPQMTGGFVPPMYPASIFVKTPEGGMRATNQILDDGADSIKVMMESRDGNAVMSLEAARAIVDTAHARGKRVSVHVSLCRDIEPAIRTGADELAHMVIDDLPPELATRVAKKGIIWIPTMEIWKGTSRGDHVVSNLRTFVEAGGKVALGTDYDGAPVTFDLGMPVKEIRWMCEAGMTPMQIIVSSTRNAAEACGINVETGTVETGKAADLFVVEGDPLLTLDALTQVRWVIHSGKIIRRP